MKIVQQWEARQWLLKKIRGRWILAMNFPARGSATRNHKKGREPFSNLEGRALSVNAKALRATMEGDTEACAGLTVAIAGNVMRIAQEKRWQRVDMDQALRIGTALIAQKTEVDELTDSDLAGIVGVSDRQYRETWKPRMTELFDRCMKPLIAEVG